MRITFSSLAGLQYITDRKSRYEAVYVGPGKPAEIYHAGTTRAATLPAPVCKEIDRRFAEIHLQDAHTRELYLREAKPCII
jgi:hypothetical protein